MSRTHLLTALAALVACTTSATESFAQYSAIATPFHNVGASYYERMGVGFGGNIGNNVFFNNGGMNNALPPFGGGNGGGGANFGFGVRGGGVNLNFGFAADSGYDAGMTSISPSVTVPNGGTGAIFSGQQRPFVTGLIPVVGNFSPGIGYTTVEPRVVSPLAERLSRLEAEGSGARGTRNVSAPSVPPAAARRIASSAERGEESLAEIRARQETVGDTTAAELASLLEAARLREEAGDIGQALIDYGRAAGRAEGPLKDEIRAKMSALRVKRRSR
jgi:hypothetical protein